MNRRIVTGVLTIAMSVMMIAQPVAAYERREGDGYSSPQEAAQAYIEAFADYDVEGMIKTFAIETYVQRFDLSKQIDRIACWNDKLEIPIAISDEYSSELAIIKREAAIANSLTWQYIIYSMDAAGYEYCGTPIVVPQIKRNSILHIIRDCFCDVSMNNSRLFDADSALYFI